MKKNILNLFLICLIYNSFGQRTALNYLDINNVNTTILNTGSNFWNLISAKYEIPKVVDSSGVRKHTIFSTSLWISAVNSSNDYLMATLYNQIGFDVTNGPVSNTYDSSHLKKWDRIWKITADEISNFKLNSNSTPDILSWPAHGDTTKGQAFLLAPFVDTDQDGIYNPSKGDYPKIKGDMCLYTILNDDIKHTESKGQEMKIEIHQMAYAWLTNDELNNTIFLDFKIVNRSNKIYDDFTVSNYVDFDLGNPFDDYVGTDVGRNLIYAYNADNNDEGMLGYGMNPPSQGCMILNHSIWSSKLITGTTSPSNVKEFMNYMKGLNLNGNTQFNQHSQSSTKYSYDGEPGKYTGWTEKYDKNTPDERRMLMSITPQTLAPGEFIDVKYAYIFAKAFTGNQLDAVNELKKAANAVSSLYRKKTGEQNLVLNNNHNNNHIDISPNPSSGLFNLSIEQIQDRNLQIIISDVTGRVVSQNKWITHMGLNQSTIDLTQAAKGMYWVQIRSNNESITLKIVKE